MENDVKSANSAELPQVYKENELKMMVELVENGLWSNVNLAKALGVNRDTITEWKKRPEVKKAYRKAILKYTSRRTDVDKILKELEIEIEPDDISIQNNLLINLTDEQLDSYIASKIRQVGAGRVIDGEGETEER